MITPEEFANKMSEYANAKFPYHSEDFHKDADMLMCNLLSELGYSKGADIFKNMSKWYD